MSLKEMLLEKKFSILFLVVIIVLLTAALSLLNSTNITAQAAKNDNFGLLDPTIAELEVDDFLRIQDSYVISYRPLKTRIQSIINTGKGNYAVYFEDLKSGSWFGIGERDEFYGASINKLYAAAAVLKAVEDSDLSMQQNVTIAASDINSLYGSLYKKGPGYRTSINTLLSELLTNSDNTAAAALKRHVTPIDLLNAKLGLGAGISDTTKDDLAEAYEYTTPKEISNVFRSLYYSSYLRRPFSQYMLSKLTKTNSNAQLVAGLPASVQISHKFGEYSSEGVYHDCGIIYSNRGPYVLCVMSAYSTKAEADRIISNISKEVYQYVTTT